MDLKGIKNRFVSSRNTYQPIIEKRLKYNEPILKMLEDAIRKSQDVDAQAVVSWRRIAEILEAKGLKFSDVVGQERDGISALECILYSKSLTSKLEMLNLIPCGDYANGRVKRTIGGLFVIRNGMANGPGISEVSSRCIFVGDFKDGLADGPGMMFFENDKYFDGKWDNGYYCKVSISHTAGRDDLDYSGIEELRSRVRSKGIRDISQKNFEPSLYELLTSILNIGESK